MGDLFSNLAEFRAWANKIEAELEQLKKDVKKQKEVVHELADIFEEDEG